MCPRKHFIEKPMFFGQNPAEKLVLGELNEKHQKKRGKTRYDRLLRLKLRKMRRIYRNEKQR